MSSLALCAEPRAIRYADLGGIESVLHDIKELVEHPLCHPEVRMQCCPPHGCWFAYQQLPASHEQPQAVETHVDV